MFWRDLLAAILVLISGIAGFAQGEVISKSDFEAVHNVAAHPNVRWKGNSYRAVIATETTSSIGKQYDYSSKAVTEYDGNGGTHSLNESGMASGQSKRYETIRIGDAVYSRNASGPWTRKEAAASDSSVAPLQPASHELAADAEYRYLGSVEFRGKPAKLYEKAESRKTVDPKSGVETISVSTTKYWFDAEGTLVRSVFRSDSKKGEMTSRTGVVMEYELDPNIRITAPKVL